MLRIPVTFWKDGKKVGEKLVQKKGILKLKQQARLECRANLDWNSLSDEFTHIIYYKGFWGYKKELQAVDIYLGSGLAVTDEMLNEMIHSQFLQDIGAFHRPNDLSIKEAQESDESLAQELSANILNTFDAPILQCTIEASKDPSTAVAKFLKALDSKFKKDVVVEKAIQLMKNDPSLKEAAAATKIEHPLFFVIKDITHGNYLSTYGDTKDLDKAEAFDNQEEAEVFLSDMRKTEDILNYISKEDLQEIIAGEKEFWGEDYSEELKFADDKNHGIIDLMSAWDKVSFKIVPVYAKEFTESKKIREAREKNIKINFAIPINNNGRIRINDAKKLLKKLSALQVLKAGITYFIKDSTGNETCWDFQKSMDPYYTYEFSCEITDEERDFYNCLYIVKRAGKLDLKNSEWEAHKVESKKRAATPLRESEQDTAFAVSEFLDTCLKELTEDNL